MDLFDNHRQRLEQTDAPLAARLRPRTLDEFIGQQHIIGPGRLLRRAIQADQLSSLLFYGPPAPAKRPLPGLSPIRRDRSSSPLMRCCQG